jgi:hypothetical protein
MGEDVSIDASDVPAYANGQRFTSKSTRKGGGYYGYKVDRQTG